MRSQSNPQKTLVFLFFVSNFVPSPHYVTVLNLQIIPPWWFLSARFNFKMAAY